jgi:hypothetical protein
MWRVVVLVLQGFSTERSCKGNPMFDDRWIRINWCYVKRIIRGAILSFFIKKEIVEVKYSYSDLIITISLDIKSLWIYVGQTFTRCERSKRNPQSNLITGKSHSF